MNLLTIGLLLVGLLVGGMITWGILFVLWVTVLRGALVRRRTRSRNPSTRLKIVGELWNERLLVDIAKTDADSGVRRAAVLKLDDDDVLHEIQGSDTDVEVRAAAAQRRTTLAELLAEQQRKKQIAADHAVENLTFINEWIDAKVAEDPRLQRNALLIKMTNATVEPSTLETLADEIRRAGGSIVLLQELRRG